MRQERLATYPENFTIIRVFAVQSDFIATQAGLSLPKISVHSQEQLFHREGPRGERKEGTCERDG